MEHKFIWLNKDLNKIYLFENNNTQFIDLFTSSIIKNINLIVSYDSNKNYNICYYKPENKDRLYNTGLFNSGNTVGKFFDYFKNNNLKCVEFEIELMDGTVLKTYFGNDLIIEVKNSLYINQLINLMPEKLTYFFSNKNNLKDKIIKYNTDSILSICGVINLEDFLSDNESYFFNL